MTGRSPLASVPGSLETAIDMLEQLSLDVTAVPGAAARAGLLRELRQAARRIARLRSARLDEQETFTELRRAQAAVERLRLRLEQLGHSVTSLAASAAAVGAALHHHRREAIEQAVTEPTGVAEPERLDGGFTPSQGVPALFPSRGMAAPLVETTGETGDDEAEALPSFDVDELFAEALAREGDEPDPASEPPDPGPEPATELVSLQRELASPAADITTTGLPGELAQLRRLGRDCLDEIGVMGNLRRLEAADPWVDMIEAYDRRLLCALDALMAYGEEVVGSLPRLDVAELALEHAARAAGDDPFRCFARTLVLGCMSGDDKVRAAIVGLRQSHPSTHRAQQEALILAPNPHVDEAMRRICRDLGDQPELVRLALEVLHARRARGLPEVTALLQHPDHLVRAWAARCLAVAEPALADAWLGELAGSEVEDDEVVVAALEGLLLHDRGRALALLRRRLEEELADPGQLGSVARRELVWLLAIGGERRDGELLATTVGRHPVELDALGWHGDPRHCPTLLGALDGGEPAAAAAALSLHRITGALPGGEAVGPYLPSREVDLWRQWWGAEGARFESGRRYRLGQPYTLEASRDELLALDVPSATRRGLAYELAVASVEPWIDVQDWVARQRAQLEGLTIPADRCPAGGWPRVVPPS